MSNQINRLSYCCLLFIWLIAAPVVWMVFAISNNIYTLQSLPWFIFTVSILVPLLLFVVALNLLITQIKSTNSESNKNTRLIKVNLIIQMVVITLSILFVSIQF